MKKTIKKLVFRNTLHNLPGLFLNTPMVRPFKVSDNNGNWLIERPLFRWARIDQGTAQGECDLLNIGYQIAILDILGKRSEAAKIRKVLKKWKDELEKKMVNVKF